MTGADHVSVARELVLWAARRAIDQHEEAPDPDRATGRCAQCTPDGPCPMLTWARRLTSTPEC